MKVFLMFRDRDFCDDALPPNADELTQDLELTTLFDAMAQGDDLIREVVTKTVLCGLEDPDAILYRQAILKDCLKHPSAAREMYSIAVEVNEAKRKSYFFFMRNSPDSIVRSSRERLGLFVSQLRKLRAIADTYADSVESRGLQRLFATLRRELDDAYLARVDTHLKELEFRDGVLVSARLGPGNGGTGYVLRKPRLDRLGLIDWITRKWSPAFSFRLHERDDGGARVLAEIRDRALNLTSNALAQSADHIESFFTMLRTELAFYVGCLNAHERLTGIGQPTCFPAPAAVGKREHGFSGLYDPCLALTTGHEVVGNDLNADGKGLVIITGANQGGKSTFLRSIGLSQLMMQCGMFAPASSFRGTVSAGLQSHFKREEDRAMESGKLDEELRRMSLIADRVRPDGMVIFNESFAATNEREGSEIARQIVCALVESHIRVFFVTHLFELAHGLYKQDMPDASFLRAERRADGTRTFKIVEGEPQATSHGEDLYQRIFGTVMQEDGVLDSGMRPGEA